MLYPISEIFTSPQGEGYWAGTLMHFIRLAGCTVGKPFPKERYNSAISLPIYTTECTTYDGRKFECDTDYRVKEKMDETTLFSTIPENVKHVCLTGGEPMMHDLAPLINLLVHEGKMVHIETSGTIKKFFPFTWITVSPKSGVLDEMIHCAQEIKLLVDSAFNPKFLSPTILTHPEVYLQPINYENSINKKNVDLCLKIQRDYPRWKISIQLHKILGVQ